MMPSSAQNEKLCFYLDAEYHPEFNMVTVALECGGGSFAGALLEIVYDDSFSFTSVKSDFWGLEFSCSLSDEGVIRVLLDGTENSYCEGRLALFCFSLCSAEGSGTFSFELRCPDEEAIYGIDGGEFYTVKNELFGAFVDIPNIIYEAEHPEYVGFYEKEGAVCFVGKGWRNGCGFEVCAVEPMNGKVDFFRLEAVPSDADGDNADESFFEAEYSISEAPVMLCLFVRISDPEGNGEEFIHFFYKGIYTEFDEKSNRLLTG